MVKLRELAYTRSGDKGSSANIGVIGYTEADYLILKEKLTESKVQEFFKPFGATSTVRYELDNLGALNFVTKDVLKGGGSLSLRSDSQGKGFGQRILEMEL